MSSSRSIVSRLCGPEEKSMKYKAIISTLPQTRSAPYEIRQYQGFWFPVTVLEATLSLSHIFSARSSDIFLCSSPKTGTTWLKALAFSIMTRDQYHFDDSTNPLLNKVPHGCVGTLEVDCATNPALLQTELPLLATHLPYNCLPPSILQSDCKIIYICREPKDTFVSWWHYGQRLIESFGTVNNAITLEQEVKWFLGGKSIYGPYWDHVTGYWRASVERPERVFFLKYEDLKSDTLCYVNKLAEFMGKPFSKEEQNQGVAERIVARCDIKSLSNFEVNRSGWVDIKPWKIMNSSFFRKGEIGDWKNLLTEDIAKSIDHITHEKFQSLGLTFPVATHARENNTEDN